MHCLYQIFICSLCFIGFSLHADAHDLKQISKVKELERHVTQPGWMVTGPNGYHSGWSSGDGKAVYRLETTDKQTIIISGSFTFTNWMGYPSKLSQYVAFVFFPGDIIYFENNTTTINMYNQFYLVYIMRGEDVLGPFEVNYWYE